jgi:hypothetical protein
MTYTGMVVLTSRIVGEVLHVLKKIEEVPYLIPTEVVIEELRAEARGSEEFADDVVGGEGFPSAVGEVPQFSCFERSFRSCADC